MGRLYDQPGATEIISRKGAKAQRKGIKRFRISCVFLCAFAGNYFYPPLSRSCHTLLKLSRRLSFKTRSALKPDLAANRGGTMRVENQIRFNEWLLGSTILCQSCGCLWLVPAAQATETYLCRQCGSNVTTKINPNAGDSRAKPTKPLR